MDLKNEDKLILAIAKISLSDADRKQISELAISVKDWNYFTQHVIQNSLGTLAFKNLASLAAVPADTISMLKQVYYKSLGRNMQLYEHFKTVNRALSAQQIPVIGLKGVFLAEKVFKDIGLRILSDIDLLVREQDAELSKNILLGLGYKESYEANFQSEFVEDLELAHHLPPLHKDGVMFEIHTKVHSDFAVAADMVAHFWANAETCVISGQNCYVLSINDLLIHLSLHYDAHFYRGNASLKSLLDIALVLNQYRNEIGWNKLLKDAERYQSKSKLMTYILLASKYFGAEVPDFIQSQSNKYLSPRIESLFINYLQCNQEQIASENLPANLSYFSRIKGFRNKIKFLINDIFPSKKYLINRYKIKHKTFYFLYYFVRLSTGIKRLANYIWNQLKLKFKKH